MGFNRSGASYLPSLSNLSIIYGFEDGKKIWIEKKEISLCTSCDVKEQKEIYDKRKLIIMSFIVTLMIISYVFSFLPTALTAMSAAILCIIFGLCSAEDVINKLHWESIIFLGTCLGIGNALTISGAGDLAGTFLMNVLGDIKQPFAIFTIFVILTFVISQFITNSTAIIIALPIALSICEIYGFNHMTFTVGITLASSYACLTPLAASQIAMTEVAGYEFLDYFKYGWKMTILVILGVVILVPLFYPLK
ncbi:MAG: anion permease [Lachnospiraceae bacterium]|nr:anion permease [Lachnospiraceae bacterium]